MEQGPVRAQCHGDSILLMDYTYGSATNCKIKLHVKFFVPYDM